MSKIKKLASEIYDAGDGNADFDEIAKQLGEVDG